MGIIKKVRRKVVFAFSLMFIALVFLFVFFQIRTSAVDSDNIMETQKIFTESNNSVVIELNNSANNENLCVFTKDDADVFTKVFYQHINDGENKATFYPNGTTWEEGNENVYYIATTTEEQSDIDSFNGLSAVEDENGNVILTKDDTELKLVKKIIVYNKAPVINKIISNPSDWTKQDVTLTVEANDENGIGLGDMAYSFDDGVTWQEESSMTFSENQAVKIKVKDKLENISEYDYEIKNIDKIGPDVNVSDLNTQGWFFKQAEFKVDLSDSGSGVYDNNDAIKVTADGANVNVRRESKNRFSVTITCFGKVYDKEITIEATDKAGNKSIKNIENLKIDDVAPTVNISNDTLNQAWQKDFTTFEFVATDLGSGIDISNCTSKVENGEVQLSKKEEAEDTYIAKVIVQDGKKINQQITLSLKDFAGNEALVTTDTKIQLDNEKIQIKDIDIKKGTGSSYQDVVKIGDKVNVSFNLNDNDGSGCDNSKDVTITLNDSQPKAAQFVNGKYLCEFVIGTDVTLNDNDKIELTKFDCCDFAGNITQDTLSFTSQMSFYDDIIISDVKFESDNNKNPLLAKNNDKVYISFSANHIIIADGSITQGDNTGIEWINQGVFNPQTKKYEYKAFLTVGDIKQSDNQAFKFKLNITDNAGNDSVTIDETYTDLSPIIYYAPIDSGIYNLTLTSDGENAECAKNGNVLSVAFKSKHAVKISQLDILGTSVEASSVDNMDWKGSYLIKGNETQDNSDIRFSVTIEDEAGNTAVTKTNNDVKKIKYYAPIKILDLKMVSNNKSSNKSIAKNGDLVETTFTTTHPVVITQGQIAGKNVTLQSDDSMHWKAMYTVANGDIVDNDYVSLLLKVNDNAGNNQVQANENFENVQKIKYYAPIQISDVVITSSNKNDGNKYAKNDDTVTVKFKTNHDVAISFANIAGKVCEKTKTDASGATKQWCLTYQIKNGDLSDLSTIHFEFKADDIAGNDQKMQKHSDSNVTNTLTYYSPITETTSISSNGKNAEYAKNSDKITVYSKTNHSVVIMNSVIFNRATTNINENGTSLKMSYTIPNNDNGLMQGVVPFNYTVADVAGNTINVNKASDVKNNSVVYDRTRPVVTIAPEFNGFTNKNIGFRFTFTDDNLNGNDISICVNGVEQVTQGEKASVSGKSFSKSIELDAEKDYEIVATVLDKASNKCFEDTVIKVIIDKTNPEITSTKIDLSKASSFKSGMKLSDYFNITEKYISEVICTITDSEGTREINFDDVITKDGKKTVNIIIKDMAGNVSSTMTYDFYIDSNPPKPVIKCGAEDSQVLSLDQELTFKSKLELLIGLDSFEESEIEDVEKFTTVKLIDKNDNVVVDVLNEISPLADGQYCLNVKNFGQYTLKVEAVDGVGNSTGLLDYKFVFKDKTIFEKYVSNKPLLYGSISAAAILVIIAIILIIRRKKKYCK